MGKGAVCGMNEDWSCRPRTAFGRCLDDIVIRHIACDTNISTSYGCCKCFLPPPCIADDVIAVTAMGDHVIVDAHSEWERNAAIRTNVRYRISGRRTVIISMCIHDISANRSPH